MGKIIEVQDLRKTYRGQEAVKGISFQIEKGELYAMLGPNGAGKTTAINILSTCVKKDDGSVIIDGLRLGYKDYEIRKRIGVVFQDGVLDDLLTVEENLYVRGKFYGLTSKNLMERIKSISKMSGIDGILERPYGKLSGGQRRRCDIARALLPFPKILMLDEPTTGLDPKMRKEIWAMIDQIQKQTGMTILLTTHYMEEAARAKHIIIMKDGRIATQGSPEQLKEHYSRDVLILYSKRLASIRSILESRGIACYQREGRLEVPLVTTREALKTLDICRGKYEDFEVQKGDMDTAYLLVTEGGAERV